VIGHHTPCAMLQYNPAPGSHGSVKFLYARIADIFMGTIITSLFTLVLPWSVPPPHHSLQQSPHLRSTVPAHAFSSPPICLQQSLHMPSAVPPFAFNRPCTCLRQFPHLPSAIPSFAFSNPPTCPQQPLQLRSATLQQSLPRSPHGSCKRV